MSETMNWDDNDEVLTDSRYPDFRATVVRDEYPDAPDWDLQAAVIRIEYGYSRRYVEGMNPEGKNFEDKLEEFMNRSGRGVWADLEMFARYLRIFHGTSDFRQFHSYSYQDSTVYVAFDSAAMVKEWGCTETPDEAAKGTADEWQAYIDGDVYVIQIERREQETRTRTFKGSEVFRSEREVWTIQETVGGYYGEEYARSEAEEQLSYYAEA
jgi:hypothetical protein